MDFSDIETECSGWVDVADIIDDENNTKVIEEMKRLDVERQEQLLSKSNELASALQYIAKLEEECKVAKEREVMMHDKYIYLLDMVSGFGPNF